MHVWCLQRLLAACAAQRSLSHPFARLPATCACRCLYVDDGNRLLLAATADKAATVYELTAGAPLARFEGHGDVISGMGYLPPPLDCYVTGSWDKQVRLWRRPTAAPAGAAAADGSRGAAGRGGAPLLLPEDSEDTGGAATAAREGLKARKGPGQVGVCLWCRCRARDTPLLAAAKAHGSCHVPGHVATAAAAW